MSSGQVQTRTSYMRPRILLVHPPIFDFSAYDFWLKPYGLLQVAGSLRGTADLVLFDYLDRTGATARTRPGGRGAYQATIEPRPPALASIPRRFRRFGRSRSHFRRFIDDRKPFDVALIATGMTYWYPGVREVIEDVRALSPATRIVLGGTYATLCPAHARTLGADLVVEGMNLDPLAAFLGLELDRTQPPWWEGYDRLEAGCVRLTEGCPFRCTYCSVPLVAPAFAAKPLDQALAAFDLLRRRGARHIAFYDDALLFRPREILYPFLDEATRRTPRVSFHTPNALNARFVSREAAERMVHAGFETYYLGFESASPAWQEATGGKASPDDLRAAVENLAAAGAPQEHITAYVIIGHPDGGRQELEASLRFAAGLGVRLMLAEFSPIPGTPDGERCRALVDMDEPLWHNKTAFTTRIMGEPEVNRIKQRCRELNRMQTA
jgi:radical SAM superfamily enzyme YgiQ (UPF0313 family)